MGVTLGMMGKKYPLDLQGVANDNDLQMLHNDFKHKTKKKH